MRRHYSIPSHTTRGTRQTLDEYLLLPCSEYSGGLYFCPTVKKAKRIHIVRTLFLLLLCLCAPSLVHANFAWPPAFYYLSFQLWWVVASGLLVEFATHQIFVQSNPVRTLIVTVASNLASALLGFIVTWPATFYEPGINILAYGAPLSVFLIVGLILALNIVIEYEVACRLLDYSRSRRVLLSFVVANVLSFAIVVFAAINLIAEALS